MIWQAECIVKYYAARSKCFAARQFKALSGLSLSVREKEIVGLVGASGSGKTTLARIAMRLEQPDSGSMYLDGRSYESYQDKKGFYRKVQMVFQHAQEALNPRWTIRQILQEPLSCLAGMNTIGQNCRVHEIMEAVQLPPELLDARPGFISGGQAQRVCLARALATLPKFIILDEPTSSLDVLTQRQMLKLLKRLHKDHGIAFLLISHDLEVVRRVADRVAFIDQGLIVEEAAPEEMGRVCNPAAKRLVTAAGLAN